MPTVEERFADVPYCYLLTAGRHSGRPHEIEVWFTPSGDTAYLLNGDGKRPAGESDWIRNLKADPMARLRISSVVFMAQARFPVPGSAEDLTQRAAIHAKYAKDTSGDLTGWRDGGFLVALDLTHGEVLPPG